MVVNNFVIYKYNMSFYNKYIKYKNKYINSNLLYDGKKV